MGLLGFGPVLEAARLLFNVSGPGGWLEERHTGEGENLMPPVAPSLGALTPHGRAKGCRRKKEGILAVASPASALADGLQWAT